MAHPAASGTAAPSRLRWFVVAGVFLLSFITIVDRVSISAAKQSMARELHISDEYFGWIFGAFALGYAVLMVPSGYLGDRYGPRRFLLLIVLAWSVLTASTGLTQGGFLLIAIRFLFGMAEAGAYPTAGRALYNWMPASERGLALGLMNGGTRIGAAAGLAIASWITVHLGWRVSFFILGAVGVIWAVAWYLLFRDRSARAVESHSETQQDRDVQMPTLSPVLWLILLQYFSNNFTLFICYTWLLPHLQDHFGMTGTMAGFYAGIPLYSGAVATWTGGAAVDFLFRRRLGVRSRAIPAMFGFSLATIGVTAAAYMDSPGAFVACFAVATFGLDLTMSPSWTVCSDLGREWTATLSSAMNMAGAVGSFASAWCFPYFIRLTGSARSYFITAAGLNLIALICWRTIARRLERESC